MFLTVANSEKSLDLKCAGDRISVVITDKFLEANGLTILFPDQIHFRNHKNCSSSRTNDGYILEILPPFDSCGTVLEHASGDYVYSNEIVINDDSNEELSSKVDRNVNRIPIQCSYDDRYVVSSEFGIKPFVKTIYFELAKGNISAEMNLYQRRDYHPKSRLGARPMVLVSLPLYVAVKSDNIFGDTSIVTSLEQCYATDQSSYKEMGNLLHYLVQGRCVSPDDDTVEIYKNGIDSEARFKFDMFKWKGGAAEFVYLHCEIRVCNSSLEDCSGKGPQCDGRTNVRKRRDASEVGPNESGITSIGPLIIGRLGTDGKAKLDFVGTKRDQGFLTISVFTSVGIILLISIILFIITIVLRRRRRFHKHLESSAASSESNFNQNSLPQ